MRGNYLRARASALAAAMTLFDADRSDMMGSTRVSVALPHRCLPMLSQTQLTGATHLCSSGSQYVHHGRGEHILGLHVP